MVSYTMRPLTAWDIISYINCHGKRVFKGTSVMIEMYTHLQTNNQFSLYSRFSLVLQVQRNLSLRPPEK